MGYACRVDKMHGGTEAVAASRRYAVHPACLYHPNVFVLGIFRVYGVY